MFIAFIMSFHNQIQYLTLIGWLTSENKEDLAWSHLIESFIPIVSDFSHTNQRLVRMEHLRMQAVTASNNVGG